MPKCCECKHYQSIDENTLVGDCDVNIPMWVPSYIIQDYVVLPDSKADDCPCFEKKEI